MLSVLTNSWALLIGIFLLMLGNGLQASLLGVRGPAAGFSDFEMSLIMSGYFAGFLVASFMTPAMIRRVGHVRVFAFLGSLVSSALLIFPLLQDPIVWTLSRVVIGFCFCGIYVTAESWLNNTATNETRGKTLSAYMIVMMAGTIAAQGLLVVPDASGFLLFIVPSVLVSLSFAPILVSITPTPAFESSKPMGVRAVFNASPLGCVGIFLLGGVFAGQFGMAAVYGTGAGLTLSQISIFVASFYVGALFLQYPLGWLSDRSDRRVLIMSVAVMGSVAAAIAALFGGQFPVLVAAAFFVGGASNPLYSLLMAHTNDFLDPEDMAGAAGSLYFVQGVGAVMGPLIIGWAMQMVGPAGYFMLVGSLLTGIALYAAYRMTQRATPDETGIYTALTPGNTPVTLEVAQEYAVEQAEAEADAEAEAKAPGAAAAVTG
jgi:MFS family permease